MPHGWRSPARSAASPPACAADAPPGVPPSIARAVADRTPIDWPALLARVRDPRERASLDALRRLDDLRDQDRAVRIAPGWTLQVVVLRLVIAIAALQIAAGFAAATAAAWNKQPLSALAPQLLIAGSFAAAALLLASASHRDRRVLPLFAAFTLASAAFARALVIGLGGVRGTGVLFDGVVPDAFAPAALWRFASLFPAVSRFTRFDLWVRRGAAAVAAVCAALFATNLLAAHGWRTVGLAGLQRDAAGNLFWHAFAAMALPALAIIFIRASRSVAAERDKTRRLGCALAGCAAPMLVAGLARFALPAFDGWMRTGSGAGRLAVDVSILSALAALPLVATFAVLVDRPFELRVPLWLRGVLSGPRGDSRERLTGAVDRLRLARGSREMAAALCRELQFGVRGRVVRVVDASHLAEVPALLSILAAAGGPVVLSHDAEPFTLLPRREREWVAAHDVALAAPIRLRDASIPALALLGGRRGGAPYDRSDRWFISTLLAGAAAAWDAHDDTVDEDVAIECARCGEIFETAAAACRCGGDGRLAALPRLIAGKFEVVRRLGSGGMGVVYLGRDVALDRRVALKTLPPLSDGSVERLRSEARAMAALNHAALATIYGLEVWRRTPVLVVEFFPHGTLADRLAFGALSAAAIVALGSRLADALSYMHQRGMLHRDVKPSNIGVTNDGEAKLLDFGLSSSGTARAGTPAYLPPEVLDGAPADRAVDLWGFARVLADAGGRRYEHLRPFFDRALAASRADRFQSAAEMRAALLACVR
jgi:tRNA A-37 threonylcarbamoyl transferase component Bud32